ncbi:hypothetical protein CH373_08865 [Leptospira perolatii]|uniref:Ribosomal processing cysteine protease Prp n=1 Tax=Leptospira perolatii TaxID=2023191 RepID=A0A2M9ZNE2_9LEPT|nr:ribosomal-processing cysteine protease Prp [Leptospira perolatii]PJZ69611.1 hypothetical protein CH360_10010 [Leptospira perolatii]PJZ73598.1 hypothetical protein CH373_08865 [Leptospira perolatii]
MIRIRLIRNKYGISGLESSGHSPKNLGQKGENILCAAVSVLVQTLYLHLKNQGRIGTAEISDGFLSFEILSGFESDQIVLTSFGLIQDGLENLRNQYPKELELIGV